MDTSQDYAHEFVPEPTFTQKVQEKLAASRFLTFSLIFHIILLVMAGGVVVVKSMTEESDFAAEGGGGLLAEETSAVPEPPAPEVQQQQVFTPTQPTVSTPAVESIVSNSAVPNTFTMQRAVPVTIKAPASSDMSSSMTKMQTAMGKGMGSLPTTMAGRAGGSARTSLMQKNKMTEKSEKAVMAGLRWLKANQGEDGSWSGKQFAPSMTGLAVLCFLGHGETPESPEFGPTVKKGVDWLMNKGTEFQGRLCMAKQFSQSGVYEHGIAAYALGEYYTMTKDDRVKDVFTQAIAHIVAGQAPDGGWQYSYAKGPDSDTSVVGWQIQALKAAHLSGLNLPGVDDTLDKAMLNLKRVNGPKGGFGYRTPADKYSLTGVGVLCTYFWKGEKDPVIKNGIKFIMDETEKSYPVVYKGEHADLYAWYYHTQACLMFGGSAWTKWNKWFQDQISESQSPDGSWPVPGSKGHGPQGDAGNAGPFYRTTLCVLMLEVYYRYMPTNK